jgi:DNA polymerase I-like protein with 3'-5' exonuclease and polymerase domains
MHEAYTKKGLDVRLVASIHDEYQFEVHNKDCEEFGLITKTAMKEVEEIYSFRCPLDSEYKIGKNWAETH